MIKTETKLPIDIKGERLNLHLEDVSYPKKEGPIQDRVVARAIIMDYDHFIFASISRNDEFGQVSYLETSGGGVEKGESLTDALKRELKEEMGITIDIISYLGEVTDYYNLINRRTHSHYFLVRKIDEVKNHLTKDEEDIYHLHRVSYTYEEARKEYESSKDTSLGKLVYNREVPVLDLAKKVADSYGLY